MSADGRPTQPSALKRTPLHEAHRRLGAKLVPFAGWEMPVQYEGVIPEHRTVRSAAGLFDVSHMGEFEVHGPSSTEWLHRLLTNDVAKVAVGQAQYNLMLYEHGGIVDDLIVYRRASDRWLVVVNAGNVEKDFAWMRERLGSLGVDAPTLENRSDEWALIALQGPMAPAILQPLTGAALDPVGTYRFVEAKVVGCPAVIARTGYTGEDGFELAVPAEEAERVWTTVLEAGRPHGLKPIGLGARDTLRLEMKYALYGNDIDETTHPLEAGLGWVVKTAKGPFVGREAVERVKAAGPARKLVGFTMVDRGIPRHGYPLIDPQTGRRIGVTTSGTQSPSLDKPIGVGYVDANFSAVGSEFSVEIRGEPRRVVVVETPFWKRPRAA